MRKAPADDINQTRARKRKRREDPVGTEKEAIRATTRIGATGKVVAQALDKHKPTDDTGVTGKVADLVLDRISELAAKANGGPSAKQTRKNPLGGVSL